MARGITFLECVVALRDEVGRDHDPSVGVSDLPGLKQKIARIYEDLWDEVDWPHLRTEFDKITLQPGQRYYDLPTSVTAGGFQTTGLSVDFSRLEQVVTWYSGLPHPVQRGILPENYATYDSTTGVTANPVLRWDVRFTGTKEQIEVWPIPSSSSYSLQFTGIPKCVRLVNDGDTLNLDDRLVVLLAASEIHPDKDKAKKLQQLADRRFLRLTGRAKRANAGYRLGMGNTTRMDPYKAVVRVR